MHSKLIEFERLENVRDLCTIKNKDGFNIKEKKLIRGIRLGQASQKDLKKLYDEYNIRMIFDFRSSIEKYELQDKIIEDQRYFDIIVQKESYVGVSMDKESKRMKEYFDKLDKQMKNKDFMIKHMCKFYYSMADDYTCRQYAKFLNLLLENNDGAYWHCSLGRDRCGIGTALLLECLDVDRETIIEDYLYTNECCDDIDLAYREFIEAYYKGIIDGYGSVEEMLKYVGIDENKQKLLKDKYLENKYVRIYT